MAKTDGACAWVAPPAHGWTSQKATGWKTLEGNYGARQPANGQLQAHRGRSALALRAGAFPALGVVCRLRRLPIVVWLRKATISGVTWVSQYRLQKEKMG